MLTTLSSRTDNGYCGMVIKTYTAWHLTAESLVSTSGFMLGIIGGLLDFASATTVVINQGSQRDDERISSCPGTRGPQSSSDLGILVVVVAVLSVTSTGVRHLRGFSVLMVVLGLVMAIMGSLMSSESFAGSSTIYSYGMVIVGVLMAINGAMMLRTPMPI